METKKIKPNDDRGDQYPLCLSREFPGGERELNINGELPSAAFAPVQMTSLLEGLDLAVKEPVRPLSRIKETAALR